MSFVDWTICPSDVTFDYDDGYLPPVLGRKPTRRQSPHWYFSFDFPVATDEKSRLIDTLRYQSPTGQFNVYDPSRPYPLFRYKQITSSQVSPESLVPGVTVTAMDATARTLSVTGQAEDVISAGDPIAFTTGGYRYYFRAGADLVLTGSVQALPVIYEPLRTLSFTGVVADRIKPTMRFHVSLKDFMGKTGVANLTSLGTLRGVEWTRAV